MAVYRTTRCPYCKKAIEVGKKEYMDSYFGSPFKSCPYCREVYIDEKMKEPALFSKSYIFLKTIMSIVTTVLFTYIFIVFIEGIVLIYVMNKSDSSGNLIFEIAITIVLSLLYLLLTKPWDFNDYITPSIERLRDEDYAEAYFNLKGKYIPDSSAYGKYLLNNKDMKKNL